MQLSFIDCDEIGNYLYQVLNIGHHTEIARFYESSFVVYRPLYKGPFGSHWACRPLAMFTDFVDRDGKQMKRFTLVTDEELIARWKKDIKGQ